MFIGQHYEVTKNCDLKYIAKFIRRDLNTCKNLPHKDVKYAVRSSKNSQLINVIMYGYALTNNLAPSVLTEWRKIIEEIIRAYRYDNYDLMKDTCDTNFYYSVRIVRDSELK